MSVNKPQNQDWPKIL